MPVQLRELSENGNIWRLNTLPATAGLDVLTKLLGIIGEPIGHAVGGAQSAQDLLGRDLGAEVMAKAFGSLASRIAQPGVVEMVKTVLAGMTKNGNQVIFDQEFAGEYGKLSQVLVWALEQNFSSFFRGNPVLQGLASGVVSRTLQTSAPSIGASGVS